MRLTDEQYAWRNSNGSDLKRTGLIDKKYRWPKNKKGHVEVAIAFYVSAHFSNFQF